MAICLSLAATTNYLKPSSFKSPLPQRHRQNSVTSTCSSLTDQPPALSAKNHLLSIISDQDRGLKTQSDPEKLAQIVQAIDAVAAVGRDTITTGSSLSATWRLLWTTEKEQLFIIKNAPVFGTNAGDVLQVIDVENETLNNVITFPPDGVFFVRSTIEIASSQRVNFRFTSAVLRGKSWELPLPPYGQGWFDTMYLDDEIRVVKDIRGHVTTANVGLKAPEPCFDLVIKDLDHFCCDSSEGAAILILVNTYPVPIVLAFACGGLLQLSHIECLIISKQTVMNFSHWVSGD